MPWKYTPEYYKQYTRETWDQSAEKYIPLSKQLDQFGHHLLAQLQPAQSEYVLDVATGPGEPAMTIAESIAPTGRVVGIDLSPNMVDIAKRTAALRGIKNVGFEVMDAENLTFPDNTFDIALSRFGFQIITDPEAAARQMLRVLKPGGRVGVTVWSTAEQATAIHVIVGPMLEFAEPDESGYLPTPYELGGPGEMRGILEQLGLERATETHVAGSWVGESPERYLDMVLEGTPLGHSLREEDPPVQEKILEKCRNNIQAFQKADGTVEVPLESVVVVARKPK